MLGPHLQRMPMPPQSPPPNPSASIDEVYMAPRLTANSLPQNSLSFHVHPPRLGSPKQAVVLVPEPLPAYDHQASRKRARHAWPTEMTRKIINVLLDEFLHDPMFRTSIYRSREERDPRFIPSGRTILEEYNKVQNIRRRYFIPLSYLLQWEQLRKDGNMRSRNRTTIEKKLSKKLETSRLQLIFREEMRAKSGGGSEGSPNMPELEGQDSDTEDGDKPVFELDIFVAELRRRDPDLWVRGVAAFYAWVCRKCSIEYILNH